MTMKDLHAAIMNLPDRASNHPGFTHGELIAYKYGHRDARHAAAELALAAAPEQVSEAASTGSPRLWFIKGWDAARMHEGLRGSVESDDAMRACMEHVPAASAHPAQGEQAPPETSEGGNTSLEYMQEIERLVREYGDAVRGDSAWVSPSIARKKLLSVIRKGTLSD
jgi:hypothetical protein